jgi:iron uptake system component EfeO
MAPAPTTLAAGVDAAALNQAVEQYEAYVQAQAEDLVQRVQEFTGTIIAGDLEAAKTLYPTSRIPWERIEPVAERFAAFDTSIDARVDDFQGETDPEFTGFHRIELGLFQNNSTDGLKPFAEKLMSDVVGLQRCISVLQIEPRDMVVGAAELIEEVAQSKITGEEDRYSRTDFWSFHANVEGSMQIVDLLRPIVQSVNPQLLADIDAGFADVNQQLDRYRLPEGGFKTYDQLTPTDKQRLQASLARLAEDLANLRGVLGV